MQKSILLAVCLPLLASALTQKKTQRQDTAEEGKPHKKKHARNEQRWMVATVKEKLEDVQANPSTAPFKPQFEILNTEHEVGHSKTVELFWQRPNTTEVKGIFFGATGCFHQGGDFFEQHEKNPEFKDPKTGEDWEFEGCQNSKMARCQGLPENVYSFKYARERGYLVFTISPQGPNSCWDHRRDPLRLSHAVKYLLKREGLPADTPMIATGASQGGLFLFDMQSSQKQDKTILPNLACLAPQCAAPKPNVPLNNVHIPTMFVWMTKDWNLTNPVQSAITKYKNHKVRVAERTPHPWKIDQLMRARGYSNETTAKMLKALLDAKGLYGHKAMARNGHIIDHPGSDAWWRAPAKRVLGSDPNLEKDTLMKDHSRFHHLMQAAYAEHEFTAEYTDHIIDFCEDKEDRNAPLRHGRTPKLTRADPNAQKCSPHCPQPGADMEAEAAATNEAALLEMKPKISLGAFDRKTKLDPVKINSKLDIVKKQ